MTHEEFWQLIDVARSTTNSPWEIAAHVQLRLASMPAEVILAYLRHQHALMAQSYTWNLWGAAYIINGGCSDDGFEYFRGWLLTWGRDVFQRALEVPDSLAGVVEHMDEADCEDMINAPFLAYQAVTGESPSMRPAVRYPALGEGWDFDDAAEMKGRYPALFARFGRS